MPERNMPFNDALRSLDAHEERLQRLEEESREQAANVARHDANLDHLNTVVELKMKIMTDSVALVQKSVTDGNIALSSQIGAFATNLTSATTHLEANSHRIEKLEEMKHQQDARWKWIKASISTLAVGALGYAAQQLLAHFLHW